MVAAAGYHMAAGTAFLNVGLTFSLRAVQLIRRVSFLVQQETTYVSLLIRHCATMAAGGFDRG